MAKEYPLSLVIRAVDKATAPLRALNARMRELTAPVRKLNNSFKALSDEAGFPRLTKSLTGVGRAVGGVGREAMALGLKLAGMATAAAYGLYRIVRGAVDAGDQLGEMAKRVGLSVDAYAQIQYAAGQADVEQEAFNGAMDQFNKRLGEAKSGGGQLLSFLNQVAPGLANQVKAAKSTEEALGLMTSAFEKVTDPGKRAALAAAAFGKSGLQMGQFLGQGTKALADQRAEFMRIAGSQEEFARLAGELDNASKRSVGALGALRNGAMTKLFPALIKLSDALTELVVKHGAKVVAFFERIGAAVSDWVDSGGVEKLATQIWGFIESVKSVVKWIGGWKVALTLVGLVMAGPLIASVVGLGSALWTLGAAILPMVWRAALLLGPALAGAASAVTSFILGINVAPILAMGSAIWGAAAAVGGFMLAAAPFIIAAAAVGAAAYAIYKNWEPLKELFSDIGQLWGAIKETFGNPWESIKTAGSWWGKELGIGGGAGPTLNAAAALPPAAAGAPGTAHVVVDFNNAPRGTRVAQAPGGTAALDLSVGYSMASSH